jgi:antitoxin component YwqK of YwqJK toxin-antitoxin module
VLLSAVKMVYQYIAEYYFYCNEPAGIVSCTQLLYKKLCNGFYQRFAAPSAGRMKLPASAGIMNHRLLGKGGSMSRAAIPVRMAGVLILLFFILGCSGESGQKDVPYQEFYQNGKLKTAGTLKGGKKEGVWKEYSEDGTLANEYTYKNGLRQGISKRYYPSGALFAEFRYVNDKREGISKRYFTNAALQAEDNYRNDVREGISRIYDGNGKVWKEESYKDGKKDGPSITYFNDGRKKSIDIFKDGRKISRQKYDRQGNPESAQSAKDEE